MSSKYDKLRLEYKEEFFDFQRINILKYEDTGEESYICWFLQDEVLSKIKNLEDI